MNRTSEVWGLVAEMHRYSIYNMRYTEFITMGSALHFDIKVYIFTNRPTLLLCQQTQSLLRDVSNETAHALRRSEDRTIPKPEGMLGFILGLE